MHHFVKISHLKEDGQQVMERLDEEFKCIQMLEYFENEEGKLEWQAVSGFASGMPIMGDVTELVAKRSPEYRKSQGWCSIDQMPPVDVIRQVILPEVTVVVKNKNGGEEKIKYELVEPPDCDAVKLYGVSTLAEGYFHVDDETGEINTTPEPKNDDPQVH